MAKLTQDVVDIWITHMATGAFHYTKVLDGAVAPPLYGQLRTMMHRARDKGIVVPVDGKDGWWRPLDKSLEELAWWNNDGTLSDKLILPLNMNKYCYIPLPSLVIIAGKYNTGKTAMCINIVNLNLEGWANKLDFYVSEGAEMMKTKFDRLNSFIPKPPPFKMYRRTEHFADVIEPDHLSVIDYLRVDMSKTYEIGNELFAIFNRLKNGIAIVAMQKPPGERKLAFGGAATAFEPTLYIAMDKDVISFEKIKVIKPLTYDPYAVKIKFKIRDGVNFVDVSEEVG